jgi:hypothetical protein
MKVAVIQSNMLFLACYNGLNVNDGFLCSQANSTNPHLWLLLVRHKH